MRVLLRGLAVALGVAMASPTMAQDVVSGDAVYFELPVSSGELVRLDRPVASVFVADSTIADVQVVTDTLIYVYGRIPGETNVFAVDAQDEVVGHLRVAVQLPVDDLNRNLAAAVQSGTVRAVPTGNSVMLTGSTRSPAEAADAMRLAGGYVGSDDSIINQMSIDGPTQINLRVRFAEVSRDVVQELGVNWESLFTVGSATFGWALGRDFVTGTQFFTEGDAGTILGSFQNGDINANVLIDALESEGFASVLAEPNLTAMSGEEAAFLAGGEFPIPVDDGNRGVTVEFRPFGISLAFTPTVLSSGRISLTVRPEVSELSTVGAITLGGISVPSLTIRRAETTVELGSGESFAIAGLFENDYSEVIDQIPVIGDLPIIGPLFRSTEFRSRQSELVIMVTPYLVQPVQDNSIVSPTDPPSDFIGTFDGPQPLAAVPDDVVALVGRGLPLGQAGFVLK